MSGGTAISYRELISVFDHIRRAAAWTRQRLGPASGRHRLSMSTRLSAPQTPAPASLRMPRVQAPVRRPEPTISAEDTVLVRPYVLTREERVRQWRGPALHTMSACSHVDIAEAP